MQCSEEAIVRLFNNTSSSFELLLIFIYVLSIILAKIFYFLGGNISFQRNNDDHEYIFSDEEMEEEENNNNEYFHGESIQNNLQGLIFSPTRRTKNIQSKEFATPHPYFQEMHEESHEDEDTSSYGSILSEFDQLSDDYEEEDVELNPTRDYDSATDTETNDTYVMSPFPSDQTQYGSLNDSDTSQEKNDIEMNTNEDEKTKKLTREKENYLVFAPSKSKSKKINLQEKNDEGEIFGDSCTNGSTSKSSSDWRSSINCSGTEDPFSSSSRRSCPNWESYTVFQKYDEEMLFLDRISAQKLSETESLRSIQACPRSISERIVYKIAPRNKRPMDFRHNPYHELESAYVAQISWTWEALNWNYKYFQRLRESRRQDDPGCPAIVAQQFQQFLVRLQRYVENEPYEHGRRPEIYARIKSLAPKLLQVPEYRDSEDEKKDEGYSSTRISSDAFLAIIEETIRTFMSFLEADKENRCQIIAGFFKKKGRSSADPTLLLLLKKINKKKKMKVKDIRRSRSCLRRRRLRETDEMEILMALIDLKLVSRVLRMSQLNDELLHWCEDKMGKVRVTEGKLFRDSSPLFFPAH
ncbi:hypothetical protein LIER_02420 [Lithospermum erythrorhizon]|uniref:Ribosomal protein L34Ae n=1 Tax=Lithospermum erythrorhizon TaxID=34254 RepID=A0AAV3NU07_LITER